MQAGSPRTGRYFRFFRNLSSLRLHRERKIMALNIENHPRVIPQLLMIILSLALSGCSSSLGTSTSSSPFEGLITAKSFDDTGPTSMTFSIKANHFRLETANKDNASGALILDLKSGIQQAINPQEKTYVEINLNKIKETGKDDAEPPLKFMPTGKTETIAGHACEHYLFEDQQKTDMCLAKGLGYIGTADDYSGWVQQFLKDRKLDSDPEFKKLMGSGVIPLKVSIEENGQVTTIMEVTAIERKPLDDALFKVPADYKKIETSVGVQQR